MLLSKADCLRLCEKPAYTADLAAGRALERRHRLHLDGDPVELEAFLVENKPELLASEESYNLLKQIAKPATKPIYASLLNVQGKVFTAQGRNFYYQFTRPELATEFDAFLSDTRRTGQSTWGQFRSLWGRAQYVGFQGVLLVDLPGEPGADAAPAPYFDFVPSNLIWDARLTGDRLEYLLLYTLAADGSTSYYCFDDQQCHRVLLQGGTYTYLAEALRPHGLGYVPACPVTTRQADTLRPVRRTSPVAESLELADVYLRDFNGHEFSKYYHIFQKLWTYGVDCDFEAPANWQGYPYAQTCNAGKVFVGEAGGTISCPACKGRGKRVPVGPDKAYILQVPTSKEDPSIVPPAGYITPELSSAGYIGKELVLNEAKIEKSVLGKSGILEMQAKQQTLGGQLIDLEPLNDRLATIAEDGERAFKFVTDTLARLRYGDAFEQSAITFGRKWQLKSVGQLEAEFQQAKKAGLDDALLYAYLEEIVYTKWAGDPMELARNLLKLELTPAPTKTVSEAALDGLLSRPVLLLKQLINDFFDRFEREEGSILDFASALSHAEKIKRIQAIFTLYLNEYDSQPGFSGARQGQTADAGGNAGGGAAGSPES